MLVVRFDLRTLQELAGQSTPTLTARYSHRRLHDLAGAVEKLPNFLPESRPDAEPKVLRATGTDDARGGESVLASCLALSGGRMGTLAASGGRFAAAVVQSQ